MLLIFKFHWLIEAYSRRWDKSQLCGYQLSGISTSVSLSEISSWISSVFPESLLATELIEGEFLPPLIIRRQVSICTSRPLFMLHISIYSCRCRFMSLFAVASSIWRNINMIRSLDDSSQPLKQLSNAVKVKESTSTLMQKKRRKGSSIWLKGSYKIIE